MRCSRCSHALTFLRDAWRELALLLWQRSLERENRATSRRAEESMGHLLEGRRGKGGGERRE